MCCGCLRHSSVSLRAPLSEREGTLPRADGTPGPCSGAAARRHTGRAQQLVLARSISRLRWFLLLQNETRSYFYSWLQNVDRHVSIFALKKKKKTSSDRSSDSPLKIMRCRDVWNTAAGQPSCKKTGVGGGVGKCCLIGADRLAKQCSNYNLISGQQAESSIPFNINSLTLYKKPLRIDFKASNRCFGWGERLRSTSVFYRRSLNVN